MKSCQFLPVGGRLTYYIETCDEKTCVLSIILFGFLQHFACGQVIFGPVDNASNGNRYFLLESSSWTIAQQQAVELGGNLATVNNANENQWLIDTFANVDGVGRNLWIGFY